MKKLSLLIKVGIAIFIIGMLTLSNGIYLNFNATKTVTYYEDFSKAGKLLTEQEWTIYLNAVSQQKTAMIFEGAGFIILIIGILFVFYSLTHRRKNGTRITGLPSKK